MNITIDRQGSSKVAVIESMDVIIRDAQDALDLMASVNYHHECNKILLQKANLTEDFFDLKTRLAGEILQKYVNYNVKLAIVGDFDSYASKSLKDFIYECNNGNQIFFLRDKQAAVLALHNITN
ncbi:DUF4180 domain-containing protein [Paenibacillus sp. KS-LC4]|uniref:DUF4180 domain-containing protein n=1 Tax=Paenibacillus sp. KS-LC4 TaxID=2979727 RepID=UPI0030D39848